MVNIKIGGSVMNTELIYKLSFVIYFLTVVFIYLSNDSGTLYYDDVIASILYFGGVLLIFTVIYRAYVQVLN
jgi:hypothetical protein